VAGKKERSDSRLNVARYQVDRLKRDAGEPGEPGAAEEPEPDNAGQATMDQRTQFVEISIAQAMRRGDFDDLPGAGKPIRNLDQIYDPDWWIRQKIENERITGLGPPAFTLKTEDAALDARLDAAGSERAVREILDDFNARVIDARRQLKGGPPVVTPTRDLDAELGRWRERRAARQRAAEEARKREEDAWAAMSWRERRRARRDRERGPGRA
jgi:hypothetical protein